MLSIKKKYIVDEENHKIAVQLDMKTYEKIEEVLENYALVQLIQENANDQVLNAAEAKAYYNTMDKST